MVDFNYEIFNEKAVIYDKTRARYSNNYINLLCKEIYENKIKIAVDIAAGTGINTTILSKYVNQVIAIEPNKDMYKQLKRNILEKNTCLINTTAQHTTLLDNSVDLITVAQAFQLLDLKDTKKEFKRILKKRGKVILVWNSKETKNELCLETQKNIKKYSKVYKDDIHSVSFEKDSFNNFFKEQPRFYKFIDDGLNYLTEEEYIGRALSASYSLTNKDSKYNLYISDLRKVFHKYAQGNLVYFPLSTIVYIGEI